MDKPNQPKRTMAWNLDIPIGMAVQVQVSTEETRFRSVYLGMKQGEFLIIQMPGLPGIRDKLINRCNLIVRFMIAGRVYGFEATVLGHVLRPAPLIFISYPELIEVINLRSAERVDTFVEAKGEIGEDRVQGIILDISENGCCFSIVRSTGMGWPNVDPGTRMQLTFQLSNVQTPLTVNAEIAASKKEIEKITVGLKFVWNGQDAGFRAQIKEYIDMVVHFHKDR